MKTVTLKVLWVTLFLFFLNLTIQAQNVGINDENEEVAYGSAYLTGNLSYMLPKEVGFFLYQIPNFRKSIIICSNSFWYFSSNLTFFKKSSCATLIIVNFFFVVRAL